MGILLESQSDLLLISGEYKMHSSDFESFASPFTAFQGPKVSTHTDVEGQRKNRRANWRATVRVKEMTSDADFAALVVSGQIVNIAAGGMCIASNVPLIPSATVVCEIELPGTGVSVPTLAQVVWVESTEDEQYFWGLRYVV